jgi:CheY-like chemotaxis protein
LSISAANSAHTLVVLVVEDEFLVRYNIAGSLQEAGYLVVEAGSGEEAIALCNSGTVVDMVLTDVNLGGSASGWDVAECFRAARPDVPVVYTSGKSIDPGRCVRGSVFVTKPYQNREILDVCQRLTARHQ